MKASSERNTISVVQLAKHAGAHVTGVCSGAKVERVRALGADEVIDYTRESFSQSGQRYDLIMDNVGNAPFSRCRGALNPGGRLLLVVAGAPEMLQVPWIALTSASSAATRAKIANAS